MIRSFADTRTERVWLREHTRGIGADVHRAAHRRLLQLNTARTLEDLRAPPGNRLEKLKGNRLGQHSIRINSQFRICFIWTSEGPENVEITDYH